MSISLYLPLIGKTIIFRCWTFLQKELGYRKQLVFNDLWKIAPQKSSKHLTENLEKEWNAEAANYYKEIEIIKSKVCVFISILFALFFLFCDIFILKKFTIEETKKLISKLKAPSFKFALFRSAKVEIMKIFMMAFFCDVLNYLVILIIE